MIIDRIENLGNYIQNYPIIKHILAYIKSNDIYSISTTVKLEDITFIPIASQKVADNFDELILEAHKRLMDIHITLEGIDIVAYADLKTESNVSKEYVEGDDYLLATSTQIKTLTIPKGYFCIIPNHFAHMALYKGHKDVKKIVLKIIA